VLRKQRNATVLMAEVKEIDADARTIYLDDERRPLTYDYLIVAAGRAHSYFGHDEWEEDAPGLKTIADAYEMRRRFLTAFELAEKAESREDRDAYMTFVVIGGGPTGVELAGMIPATAGTFRKDFRRIDTCKVRVLLLEGSPRVLAAFPEDLSERANATSRTSTSRCAPARRCRASSPTPSTWPPSGSPPARCSGPPATPPRR
jgi:NADH dehydrogenase